MPHVATHALGVPPRGIAAQLRGRVALTFMMVALAACGFVVAMLLSGAASERQAIRDRALSTAVAISFGFDQDVAAVNFLLKGLSSSPALKFDDPKGFYDQLKATPLPDGAWLILQDMDGQVINTLLPFGSTLPKHRDFPTYPEALNRIHERGWTVSGRMASRVKPGTTIIALSLRIDDNDGVMKGFITTILSQDSLAAMLRHHPVSEGWVKGLYDRKLQPIVTMKDGETSSQIPIPRHSGTSLPAENPNETIEGVTVGADERGVPVLIAYRTSGATNWTTVVSVPLALVNAPITNILWQMAGPVGLLLVGGGLAALLTARQVERPLRTLSSLVTEARGEIVQLSEQLLTLQEEERQLIARELHDSTAQHLVATNLGLMRLATEIAPSTAAMRTIEELGSLLDKALTELRVFTYLLHPPNLANGGLHATLQEFIDGFSRRTGLQTHVRVSDGVDDAPPEIQRSILRVVQEALINVYRHADASQAHVTAKLRAGYLLVRVRDNGRGISEMMSSGRRPRLGVGIPGMHARLQQFGGNLKIRTGSHGTSLLAYLPLPGRSIVGGPPPPLGSVGDFAKR